MPETTVMPKMTGAAALHVLLMRISRARDAYEVFGWTADTVFTRADMHALWAEFGEVMDGKDWRRHAKTVWKALVVIGDYQRWIWAMPIVAAREQVMDDLSDDETDAEA
jgi:hypothetical protein